MTENSDRLDTSEGKNEERKNCDLDRLAIEKARWVQRDKKKKKPNKIEGRKDKNYRQGKHFVMLKSRIGESKETAKTITSSCEYEMIE